MKQSSKGISHLQEKCNLSHQGNSYSVVLFSWENTCKQYEISTLVSYLVELLLSMKTQTPNVLSCYNLQYQQQRQKDSQKLVAFSLFSSQLSNVRVSGCV